MRLVILESPFAGDVERNTLYARRCVRDSLLRGEAPIASHLLYTQPGILDDQDALERQHGIDAGLAWRTVAQASVVYIDFGISAGMAFGIAAAQAAGLPVEFRTLSAKDTTPGFERLAAAAQCPPRQGFIANSCDDLMFELGELEGIAPHDILAWNASCYARGTTHEEVRNDRH